MKLIGKQIVVELPEKKEGMTINPNYRDGCNDTLSEVAKMNPAWEVDWEVIKKELYTSGAYWKITKEDVGRELYVVPWGTKAFDIKAKVLASDPSAWMKRKDSDE